MYKAEKTPFPYQGGTRPEVWEFRTIGGGLQRSVYGAILSGSLVVRGGPTVLSPLVVAVADEDAAVL